MQLINEMIIDQMADWKLRFRTVRKQFPWVQGVYVCGSICQDDYQNDNSDLDILVISNKKNEKEAYSRVESDFYFRFNFPNGVELCIVTQQTASSPPRMPSYEFRFSRGGSWIPDRESEGTDGELLIHFEICRSTGICLFGEEPEDIIGPTPREWIIEELKEGLSWHLKYLLDPYHDPYGRNSTLNACRALFYSKTGILVSKSFGGEWFYENFPSFKIVKLALDNRKHNLNKEPDYADLYAFVETIHSKLN